VIYCTLKEFKYNYIWEQVTGTVICWWDEQVTGTVICWWDEQACGSENQLEI
jgi:hypothetical protein